uniref:Uncharacterized protein n=1 Tax=Panagrellus redivivus TaxID=6233 RepID=A0A7E4URE8_PANRE
MHSFLGFGSIARPQLPCLQPSTLSPQLPADRHPQPSARHHLQPDVELVATSTGPHAIESPRRRLDASMNPSTRVFSWPRRSEARRTPLITPAIHRSRRSSPSRHTSRTVSPQP